MARRRWQALRFLRVLLACALFAFAARPSSPAPTWTEIPALVARARAALTPAAATRAPVRASRPTRRSPSRPLTSLALAPLPPARSPAPAAPARVLVPDRYLRNCALLC